MPAVGKAYMDEVLAFGFAYDQNGALKLKGKTLKVVVTTGGPAAEYAVETPDKICHWLEVSANFIGMKYEKPFFLYGDDKLDKVKEVVKELEK